MANHRKYIILGCYDEQMYLVKGPCGREEADKFLKHHQSTREDVMFMIEVEAFQTSEYKESNDE